MKLLIIILFFMMGPLVSLRASAQDQGCSSEPKIVMGVKEYQRCYCEGLTYPEIDKLAESYGVKITPSQPVAFNGYGRCGVSIAWEEDHRPHMPLEKCIAYKKEFLAKMDEVQKLGRNLSGFYCGYNFDEEPCVEGQEWACKSLKEHVSRDLAHIAKVLASGNSSDPDLLKIWQEDLKRFE